MKTPTKILAWTIPLLVIGCGDAPKSAGTDTSDGSGGAQTGTTATTTTAGTGSGAATGSGSGSPTGSPTGDPTGPTTTATTSTSDTGGGCNGAPVFETDIIPIFNNSCGAGDNACHSRVAYAADANADCRGWLALEDEALGALYYAGPMEGQPTGCSDMELYMRLTQLDAWQCEQFDPRIRYVVPCEPENSYIMRKIDGGPYCLLAQDMPSQPMPMGVVLDPKAIDTMRAWIMAGAPRLGDPCPIDCGGVDPGPQDPVATINHPGDGENRPVNVDIPFIGLADDPQDGMIPPNQLVWTSDIEGQIGIGDNFNAPLTMVGKHTITLTATDSDNNQGSASIVLNIE